MSRKLRRAGLSLLFLAFAAAGADLEKGLSAVERRDWAAALAEFRPLAEKGDPDAAVNLGNLYMKGLGVPEDYESALRWFQKAAEQGSAVAQGKLGLMHYYGFGVPENHAEAARWFQKAAGGDDPGAASILGTLYATGDGVAKDKAKAYFWYTVASERGHETALQSRNALVDEMGPGEINEALERIADWRRKNEPPDAPAAGIAKTPAAPGRAAKIAPGPPPEPKPKQPAKPGGKPSGTGSKAK